MRPPVNAPARRPHLMTCPRCGEFNGVTAIACWKCDLPLMPAALLEPRPLQELQAPPEDASPQPPVLHAEVPSDDVSLRIGTLARSRRDDPHTLPPFVPPVLDSTANEPSFAPRAKARRVQPLTALILLLGGGLIGALIVGWMHRDEGEAAVARPPPDAVAAVSSPERPALPAPGQAAAPVTAPPAVPPTAQPAPVAVNGPASEEVALPPAPAARAPQEPPATRAAGARSSSRRAVASRRSVVADAPEVRPAPREGDVPPPPPVQAPCTPQVAALGLCSPTDR
jgi:hypothetical protein